MSNLRYSEWASGMLKSDISEILRLSREPGMLSLAAGVPFPRSYPAQKVEEIVGKLVRDEPQVIFPYGHPQGTVRCRESVVYRMFRRGVKNISPDNVVMTSGSTAAMDMITRMTMDPGDTIIIEAPTFMGCLDSIKNWGFNLVEVPIDDDGIRTGALRDTLARLKKDGVKPKMLYLMSNYHNPAGIMISQERRRELPEIAEEFDFFIAEDDAYSELLYDDNDQTPIKEYDTNGRVFYLGSFSKLVAPGFRVGFAVVPDDLVKTWNVCRPMLDVGSPTINQEIIAELHRDNWIDGHIEWLIEGYRGRRDAMIDALDTYMPSDCTWTPAHGGFYVWVTTPEGIDNNHLLETAIKNGIIYFTGKFFYLDQENHGHFRLCFSLPDEDVITEGVKRIAASIRQEIGNL
ncbi:MAG: PLP-dependent aminotransferase family protein [Candidatus Latescibacteria bacterium]|nr:PLP-dependent aminotransferase family protein [Candidatus Latescibacterota bacterium]